MFPVAMTIADYPVPGEMELNRLRFLKNRSNHNC